MEGGGDLHPSGGRRGRACPIVPKPRVWAGQRHAQRLTQGVGGHPREDDPVGGEEDGALGREHCGATPAAPGALLTPVGEQVDTQAVQHTLLTGQQVRP